LAIGLPMVALVLQFAARLLAVMGDEAGARVVRAVAAGGGVLWALSLLGIVIVTAIETLRREEPPRGPT
jgi:hypothetical protein